MKKLLAVLMMSVSFFVAQAGYTQSLYTGENYSSIAHYDATEGTNIEPQFLNKVREWIFRGMTYLSYFVVLYNVWEILDEWLDMWEGVGDPDLDDWRIRDVCEFYEEYKDDNDLGDMGEILEEGGYCTPH